MPSETLKVRMACAALGGKSVEVNLEESMGTKKALTCIKKALKLKSNNVITSIRLRMGDAINLDGTNVSVMGFVNRGVYDVNIEIKQNVNSQRECKGKAPRNCCAPKNKDCTKAAAVHEGDEITPPHKDEYCNPQIKAALEYCGSDHKKRKAAIEAEVLIPHMDKYLHGKMEELHPDIRAALENRLHNKDTQEQMEIAALMKDVKGGVHDAHFDESLWFRNYDDLIRKIHVSLQEGCYSIKRSTAASYLGGAELSETRETYGIYDVVFEAPKGTKDLFNGTTPEQVNGLQLIRNRAVLKDRLEAMHEQCCNEGDWTIFDLREMAQEEIWSIVFIANMIKVDTEMISSSYMVLDRNSIAHSFKEMLEIVSPSPDANTDKWECVPSAPGENKWKGEKKMYLGAGF